MSAEYKTTHKLFSAWEYRSEIEYLNSLSEKGWQLIKGGSFSQKFKKNDNIRYRYQLDFPGEIEDLGRYIETFREQGWEYVNGTANGWHYFRKPYDPSLPEEEYEILTDRSSVDEMAARLRKGILWMLPFVIFATICFGISFAIRQVLPTFIQLCTYAALSLFVLRAAIKLKNIESKKRTSSVGKLGLGAFIILFLLACYAPMFLIANRPSYDSNMMSDETAPISQSLSQAVEWQVFEVKYIDNYYISLSTESETSVCITILNSSGEEVYSVKGTNIEEDIKLRLSPDTYTVYISDFAGGALDIDFEID